jgi:hypothetical protein
MRTAKNESRRGPDPHFSAKINNLLKYSKLYHAYNQRAAIFADRFRDALSRIFFAFNDNKVSYLTRRHRKAKALWHHSANMDVQFAIVCRTKSPQFRVIQGGKLLMHYKRHPRFVENYG